MTLVSAIWRSRPAQTAREDHCRSRTEISYARNDIVSAPGTRVYTRGMAGYVRTYVYIPYIRTKAPLACGSKMEEQLRELACLGSLDGVKKLLQSGTGVNSQNTMNGW